jgi:chaperonin GroES
MIKVTGHRVLIKEDPVEKKTKGGIILATDEKRERAGLMHGILVSVGPDCWKAFRKIDREGIERDGEPWARKGDYVLFARHAGRFIKDPTNGDEFVIMNDEDILGVISSGSTQVPANEVRDNIFEAEDLA